MKSICTLIVFLILSSAYGQGVVSNACHGAMNACNGDIGPFSSGVSPSPTIPPYGGIANPSTNPNPGNAGCLSVGELNPNWLLLTIETTGQLEFQIYNTLGPAGYLDWIMWAYDSTACQQIALDSLAPVSCNTNASSTGSTGMSSVNNLPLGADPGNFETPINVNAGDQFIVCFSNYSALTGNFGVENFGSAAICQSSIGVVEKENTPLVLISLPNAIELKGTNELCQVSIVEMQGRVRIQQQLQPSEQLETHGLEAGVYMVFIESNGGTQTLRYFKE